ncbi:hypothetical protein [Halarchaeum sp. P4]|uniref:hypothetical protein n=1 Tax=Halarchaeum sp. P4 TaxID=3421639 RepID=UPI003EBDF854
MARDHWRVLLALRELDREHAESSFDASEVATRAGLDLGVTERELEYLERLGAATSEGDGELEFTPTDLPVEDTGRRHDTLRELDAEEREALLDAINRGDVDPADALYDVDDAVDAAERALGAS